MPNRCISSSTQPLDEDHFWCQLYPLVTSHVWAHIRKANVSSWRGQESDIVQDIVQETVFRIFMYMRQANDDATSIRSLSAFSRRIARNHCIDLQRKAARLIHPLLKENLEDSEHSENAWERWVSPTEPIEEVLEELALSALLLEVVPMIADLPPKQRLALLIDLASLTDFNEQPGALELAFLGIGIELRSYQQPHPTTAKARSQHASLRCTAYKRLREIAYPHLQALDLVC